MTDDRDEIDPCEARLRQAVLQLSERDAELSTLRAERDDALQSCEIVADDRDAKVKDVMTLRAENEALREALKPFVDFYEGALASYSKGYEERMLADVNTHTIYGWNTEELTHPMFGKARDALSPKES